MLIKLLEMGLVHLNRPIYLQILRNITTFCYILATLQSSDNRLHNNFHFLHKDIVSDLMWSAKGRERMMACREKKKSA